MSLFHAFCSSFSILSRHDLEYEDDTYHSNSHRSGSVIRTPHNHHSRNADKNQNMAQSLQNQPLIHHIWIRTIETLDTSLTKSTVIEISNLNKRKYLKTKDFARNKYAQSTSSFSQSSSFNSTTSPSTLKTVNNSEASQSTSADGSDALQNSDASSDETATHSSKHGQFRFKRVAGRVATPALVNDVQSSSNLSSTQSFRKRPVKASTPFQHKN